MGRRTWRRLVSAALVAATVAVSACSYATMPRIEDVGPRGPGARGGRPCSTSRIAPRLDSVWVATGGIMIGEGAFVAGMGLTGDDDEWGLFSSQDLFTAAIMIGGTGAVLWHYARKSRRYGYSMAARCEDERHVEPAYCVVDQVGDVWHTTIIARNDGPLSGTFAVVANVADASSPPRELVEIVTLAPDERREVSSFARRDPVTSCTVELRPLAQLAPLPLGA